MGAFGLKCRPTRATVILLALADLRHEWVLTLCLVLALASVISPLLILMGLKHGTVETLRCSLLEDPAYRELRPAQTHNYDSDWFHTWQGRSEIAFLIPTILPASSIIGAARPDAAATQYLDLIPTGPGDPLLLGNGGLIPGANEVVLTQTAAEALGVQVGDALELRATRSRAGQSEQGTTRVTIRSVLSPRASILARVYAPLDLVLDVESYKEGMAVPSRGWTGGSPTPYASYDGLFVVSPERLTPVQQAALAINTGLTRSEELDRAVFLAQTGLVAPDVSHLYKLGVSSGSVQMSSVRAVKEKLRGTGAVVMPYVFGDVLRVAAGAVSGADTLVFGVSLSLEDSNQLGFVNLPWGSLRADLEDGARLRQILLPPGQTKLGDELEGLAESADAALHFPLRVAGIGPPGVVLAPAELLGILRTAADRPVIYDSTNGGFLLGRTGFQGFRMYARNIDDVVGLENALRDQGIEVFSQAQALERIRILDRGLTRVFWLVAVVGITGGVAALIASLYAAVQRKRRDLGVMRLLGLARHAVFRFPIYQGTAVAGFSILLGLLAYFVSGTVINQVFAADLALASQSCQTEQHICALPISTLVFAFLGTLVVAYFSSLIAAWKTTRIDPAEALREE